MKYFDAHCHLQFEGYDADRDSLIARMRDEGVGGIVVGVDRASIDGALSIAEAHEHIYASVGLHPNDTLHEVFDEAFMRVCAAHPRVVAIGECGLDYFRPENLEQAKQKQQEVFWQHIELAVQMNKPLMIHARPSKGTMDAYEDALGMLEEAKREHPGLRGDFHFFVGDTTIAKRILELDFTMSFTAVLTFTHDYDDVVRYVPLTHLLSETDAPFVAPASRRGERNDPFAVRDVVRAIAQIREEDEEAVRQAILENARTLFQVADQG
ncbi:MAG: TatD family hydrolase [Bacillota bacterium]